jgi:hypothetical protein
VLGGPLNVSYLREPPHCFVEDTSSRQMSDGLTPAAVVVTFSLLSPHVRMLLFVFLINVGGIFILSQVRIFWCVYAVNLKGKNSCLDFSLTSYVRILCLSSADCMFVPSEVHASTAFIFFPLL